MTDLPDLIEEPQFRVGECVTRYIEIRGVDPDAAIIDERSYDYLKSVIKTEEDGTVSLSNSAGVTLSVFRPEEISARKRAKLGSIKGLPLYLCQTGVFGRIIVRSIRHYNLEDATYQLAQS